MECSEKAKIVISRTGARSNSSITGKKRKKTEPRFSMIASGFPTNSPSSLPMAERKSSPMKRRRRNEKCSSAFWMADLCEGHGEDNDKHRIAPRPIHRRAVAGSSAPGEGAPDIGNRRRHSDRRHQRGDFSG